MKPNFLIVLFLIITFYSCETQVKTEDRIEQEFKYGSFWYFSNQKHDGNGEKNAFGKIRIMKDSIIVEMNNGKDMNIDKFKINTVTLNKSGNKYSYNYNTDKGYFSVSLEKNKIYSVSLNTGSDEIIFKKTEEVSLTDNKLPLPIDIPLQGWKRIEINDIGTIDLSPKLEIQSGKYKEIKLRLKDKAIEIWGIKYEEPKLILQPKGINQLNDKSLSKYCRVIIETTQGTTGEFQRLNEKLIFSSSELTEQNEIIKNQTQNGFLKTPLRLIEWHPIQISEINGMPCIYINYIRQFEDSPYVNVEEYIFMNYDSVITLTISYRIEEKEYWSSTLKNTLNSFRINNIK